MRILFQGDSITDAGRAKDNDISVGVGYANLVKAHLSANEPYQYQFYNRGISGNRVVDLYSRVKIDCWNHKPDEQEQPATRRSVVCADQRQQELSIIIK